MTMRYAHLAPAHKQDAVDKLAAFNRAERERWKKPVVTEFIGSGRGKANWHQN